jgi:hypothetical protein
MRIMRKTYADESGVDVISSLFICNSFIVVYAICRSLLVPVFEHIRSIDEWFILPASSATIWRLNKALCVVMCELFTRS